MNITEDEQAEIDLAGEAAAFIEDPMDYVMSAGVSIPQHPKLPAGSVKIKLLPHHEGLPLPEYKTALASGLDLSAANYDPIPLNSMGNIVMVPTGISIEVPVGYEVQVRPRSGLASKNGITVVNTPGTVDADYRGEISVALVNLSGRRFTVERGMRIAQIVICPVVQADLEVVEELSISERGSNGFGSTGV